MINVSGKTWNHKERLKELGGVWNDDIKQWSFYKLSASELAELKSMPGCMVTEATKPASRPAVEPFSFSSLAAPDRGRDGGFQTAFYGNDKEYFNYFKDKNPAAFFGFTSLRKFADFIEQIPKEVQNDSRRNSAWCGASGSFYGTRDMQESINLARNGWIEGVELASKLASMITIEHAQQKRRTYSVAGGGVSVGRMLAGNPSHMRKRIKQSGSRNIRLFIQNNGLATINSDTLIIRGALCCAIVDILENSGYSCELIAVTTDYFTHSRKPSEHLTVKLKQSGEKISISDVAFAIGHPSYFRRFGFACIAAAQECLQAWSDMGTSTIAFSERYMPPGANDFYIPHPKQNYKGDTLEEKARKMLPDFLPKGLPIQIGE